MKLKEIDRTVHVAWSPVKNQENKTNGNYFVAGTAAQQLDASFRLVKKKDNNLIIFVFLFNSTSSQLEVFQVNLADRNMSMMPIMSIKTDYRFVLFIFFIFLISFTIDIHFILVLIN